MTWHLVFALLMLAWNVRLLHVNDRLRQSPSDRAWREIERHVQRNPRDPRHPSSAPRTLPS